MIFCQCGCLLDHCKNSLLQFVENISQQADAKVMFCLRERGNYKNSCPAQQIKTLSECIQNVETNGMRYGLIQPDHCTNYMYF